MGKLLRIEGVLHAEQPGNGAVVPGDQKSHVLLEIAHVVVVILRVRVAKARQATTTMQIRAGASERGLVFSVKQRVSCTVPNPSCGVCDIPKLGCVIGKISDNTIDNTCGANPKWTCGTGVGLKECEAQNAACKCNSYPGWCSYGTPSNDNQETACGTVRTWDCGSDHSKVSCTSPNEVLCMRQCSRNMPFWYAKRRQQRCV